MPKKIHKDAEAIYKAYPRHVCRPAALAAITRAIERTTVSLGGPLYETVAVGRLMARTLLFKGIVDGWPKEDRRFICHPATWFNQERYNEDESEWGRGPGRRAEFPDAPVPDARRV